MSALRLRISKGTGKRGVPSGGGTVLQNRYLLGRVLGQGGFGITYIGYDNTLDARVAIKEYYPGDIAQRTPGDKTVTPYTQASADYEHGKKRFIEEARTLARFSDFPGIVSVKDCFEEDNTAYMVMQFLEGIDLKEYLNRKGGKISPEEGCVDPDAGNGRAERDT